MEQDGQDINLPDCSAPFIVSQLLEIGPVIAGAMGVSPIDWRDLHAWQCVTGVPLPPWQSKMLVELSREYVAFSRKAEKADCPPPWAEISDDRRQSVDRAIRIGFRALMASKPKSKRKG